MGRGSFQAVVDRLPTELKSLHVGADGTPAACVFGVPQGYTAIHPSGHLVALDMVPDGATEFYFYLGGDHLDLFEAYAESGFPRITQVLHVGNSSIKYRDGIWDLDRPVQALSDLDFPNLRSMKLGVFELHVNTDVGLFGSLGDVTAILQNKPALEELGLFGYFELRHAVSFPELKRLEVDPAELDGHTRGRHSPSVAINNLLTSTAPALSHLEISIGSPDFSFADEFLQGECQPSLKTLVVEFHARPDYGASSAAEMERLASSPLASAADLHLTYLD